MSYYNIYQKRLNHYGADHKSRIQAQREKDFENYLLKSVYRIDFTYNNEQIPGSFEKYKQDDTQTLGYLLTRRSFDLLSGTILQIPDKHNTLKPWMVYYEEYSENRGYNKYVMLKMTHSINWTDSTGTVRSAWGYLFGKQRADLNPDLRSGLTHSLFFENNKYDCFITPLNEHIKMETYFEIGAGALQEHFRVIGYDRQSTEGVEFVSIDPIYKYDLTPKPVKQQGDSDEDFFFLNGGDN